MSTLQCLLLFPPPNISWIYQFLCYCLFPSPLQLSPAQVTLHCCSNHCSACSQQSSTYPFLNWLQLPICSLRLAIISLLHVLCHGVPITICPSPLQITHPSIPPFLHILLPFFFAFFSNCTLTHIHLSNQPPKYLNTLTLPISSSFVFNNFLHRMFHHWM